MTDDGVPDRPTVRESAARRYLVWILVSLSYVAVTPYFPRINNPNENVRIWMTRAIALDHTMSIDKATADWGYVDDKAVSGGHLYSSKAPGTSFLGVPVLWLQAKLWRAWGWPSPSKRAVTLALRDLTIVPSALLFLLVFGRWVERRTRSTAARDLLTVAVGLGTLLYPYGVIFVGHAQAAMLGFGAFMALGWAKRDGTTSAPSPRRLAMAGALAGAAVIFEYQMLIVALAAAGWAAWRSRARAAWFALGALPPAIFLGTYHAVLFGRPWAFPYGHLENQTYAHLHHSGGFFGLQGPRLDALGASLFSVDYGLFVFSPFLLAGAILAVRRALRPGRSEALAVLGTSVALLLFLAGMTHWRAGWCVGPRYIAGIAPLLACGLALDWSPFQGESRGAVLRHGALVGLVAVSVFLNGISAATYPHYPEQFNNPIFDLALPLWRAGYIPSGLGHTLGLPRLWALLPVATLWLTALTIAAMTGTTTRRLLRLIIALAVALAILIPLSTYGRHPSPAETHATTIVRSLWDAPISHR